MITIQEIEHLAKLARIELAPGEAEKLTSELDSILGYVGQITSVTGGMSRGISKNHNILREDVIINNPGEYTEALLANAPGREDNYVKVKKIL